MNIILMRAGNFPSLSSIVGLALSHACAHAQPALDWSLIDGIGGVSGHGQIELAATISADDASLMANRMVSIQSVFEPWPGFFPGPAPGPLLQISLSTNHVILSWPAAFSQHQLEYAASLPAGTNWTSVPDTPATVEDELQVALPAADLPRFYRLRRR